MSILNWLKGLKDKRELKILKPREDYNVELSPTKTTIISYSYIIYFDLGEKSFGTAYSPIQNFATYESALEHMKNEMNSKAIRGMGKSDKPITGTIYRNEEVHRSKHFNDVVVLEGLNNE